MPTQAEFRLFIARLEGIDAPYMVTGAVAAILYGQSRTTNDVDVALSLAGDTDRAALLLAFPKTAFYVPPSNKPVYARFISHGGHQQPGTAASHSSFPNRTSRWYSR